MKAVSRILWLTTVSILMIAHDAVAQSADELAKQTQNPVASLISVPFQATSVSARERPSARRSTFNRLRRSR